MATKFFTNKDENTLLEKFKGFFAHNKHIKEFDALVGYFRSAGYFKIQRFLKDIPNIRILVGINVDELTAKYKKQGILFHAAQPDEAIKNYQKKLQQEIDKADYSEEIEKSILQFIQDITDGKLKIKAHPSRKLHAKIYIFRPENFNSHNMGEVITGSSNLSEAGLGTAHSASNYEFNVSLRDYEDVRFATDEFEDLWKEGVEILPEALRETQNKTFLKDAFTPFELYMKMLITYFGNEIEFNPDDFKDLPEGLKHLTYQLDAMNQGFEILKKHNGFFLADVVGLGKTLVAILIARQYLFSNRYFERGPRMLIVIPPALKGQWKETVRQFRMQNQAEYITNGSLHKVEHPEDYDLIIVDEAHKFRSDLTLGYESLQRICKTPNLNGQKKKVILVSATPLNNHPDDIRNQVLLFQDANHSTLDFNLGAFFSRICKRYKDIINEKDSVFTEKTDKTAELYTEVRNKVIEPLTVRRTRTDLMQHELYKKDLEQQGIQFPKISEPQKLLYPLDEYLNELYDETVRLIRDDNNALQYIRYRAIEFMKPEHAKDYNRPDFISFLLAGIMKTLLLKRLDSSFYAFHCTLKRFFKASEAMLRMVENNRIIIAPNHKVENYIMEENEEELLKKLSEDLTDPSIKILKRTDFKDDFIEGLKNDHKILTRLESRWHCIIKQDIDPKLEKFFSVLDDELLLKSRNPEQKLIIFSESQETTYYLKDKLTEKKYAVLAINSQNRESQQETIRDNFNANVPIIKQKSEYNILITTEVLAEGVDLHRSNIVLNYDTPWNSTRLMQRIGRVNRIGTKTNTIYIYNFFPTEKVEGDIQLRHRAIIKLQAFHSALGEDSQIYSTDEKVESFGLFDKNPQEDSKVNERLQYLMEVRRFREKSPDEFQRIKGLPHKIRNAVRDKERQNSTLSYLQNKRHNAFYQVNQNGDLKELGFLEAAPILKCDPSIKALPLHKKHHKQVKQALEHFVEQAEEKILREQQTATLTTPQNRAIKYIKAIQNWENTREEEKEILEVAIQTIRKGKFQPLPRDVIKLQNQSKKGRLQTAVQLESLLRIVRRYPMVPESDENTSLNEPADDLPSVILSQSYILKGESNKNP